jgi:hypothetical protein
MRLFDPTIPSLRRCCQLGGVLTGLAVSASVYAAAPPAPMQANPDAVVVSDAPLRHPKKHREVKPGPAKPKAWPSKQLPLLDQPGQTRSPS